MTIGELIAHFAQYIYGFWPIRVVNSWEQGVLVRAGQVRKLLTSDNGIRGTGLHFFCPGLSEVWKQEANIETILTPSQTHTTEDGVSVCFNLAVRYLVVDLSKVYTSIHDIGATLVAELASSAGALVGESTYEEARAQLGDDVWRDLSERFEGWGIELQAIELANFARARALRVITGAYDMPGAANPAASNEIAL